MGKINLFVLSALFWSGYATAQHRYIVHFTDKADSPYSIDAPEVYLSARAIDRRARYGIALSEEDLPVNPGYVSALRSLGAEVFYKSRWFNAVLAQMEESLTHEVAALAFVDRVEFVAPGGRLTGGSRLENSQESPPPPLYNARQNDLLGIPSLHAENLFGEGLMIALLDGGFRGTDTQQAFAHLLADSQLTDRFNFVENDENVYQYTTHGTRVLSTIGAVLENEYQGVAPNAHFLLYITEEVEDAQGRPSEYRIEEYNMLFATEVADSAGADIISASLGYSTFDDPSMDYMYEDLDGKTAVATKAFEKAFEKGLFVVASAGNEGNGEWQYITVPADGAHVMSVGAVNESRERATFSSVGPGYDGGIKPDVMAVGSGTLVVTGSGMTTGSGTSFAAPQIAGLAALLWQKYPELSNTELFDLILSLGDRFGNPDNLYGHGIPNADESVTSATDLRGASLLVPNPFYDDIAIEAPATIVSLSLFNPTGLRVKYRTNLRSNRVTLRTSDLLCGIYLLQVVLSNGETTARRIMKK